MTIKEQLFKEIENAPESLLRKTLTFLRSQQAIPEQDQKNKESYDTDPSALSVEERKQRFQKLVAKFSVSGANIDDSRDSIYCESNHE